MKEGLGAWSVTGSQELAFNMLVDDLVPICRPTGASAKAGRGIPRLENLMEELASLEADSPEAMIQATENMAGVAQSVDVDAVARRFPPVEYIASVDPMDHLKGRRRQAFANQDLFQLNSEEQNCWPMTVGAM